MKQKYNNVYMDNVWIVYGYFCIEFIDFMLKGKSLLDYAN